MESNQNENVIIDGENKIGLKEWNTEYESMNGSLQTKQNIAKEIPNLNENNEMEKKSPNIAHLEKKIGKDIVECNLLGFFIV
jgi:hypothetical protein